MSTNKDLALDLLEAGIEAMRGMQEKFAGMWERPRSENLDILLIQANRELTVAIATFGAIASKVNMLEDSGEADTSNIPTEVIFPDEV